MRIKALTLAVRSSLAASFPEATLKPGWQPKCCPTSPQYPNY